MNYNIIFSTYQNKTGKELSQSQVIDYLKKLSKEHNLQGWSLANQIGYYAGTTEFSYTLAIFDISKSKAQKIGMQIARDQVQESVILQLDTTPVTFLNNSEVTL